MTVISVKKASKAHAKIPQINKLLAPLGGNDFFFCEGETIAILADCSLPLSAQAGVNCDPSLIYAVTELALVADVAEIKILLSPAEGFSFKQVLTMSGYDKLVRDGVKIVDLHSETALSRDSVAGLACEQIDIYESLLSADLVINMTKFKADDGLLFGGAIANLQNASPDMETRFSNHKNRALIDIMSVMTPDLTIIDCLKGSAGYQQQALDALIAGRDPVALDTTLAALAGLDASQIDYLCLATQYAMGHSNPGEIVISGDDLAQIMGAKNENI